jgi:hypothetical protein
MKRYVNFMSNPDERTAIDQFGSGDKYFGVCTLLATLPGLPMFGHGQIEGFTERYGMEFKQARLNEWPNDDLIARHQYEIAPLLKKRYIFAGSSSFTLYDFWSGYGAVDENVFAYSNRFGGERSLVLYNNKYDSTSGTIHISVAYMDKGSGALRQRSLADGLGLPTGESAILAYRDTHGLEYLRRASDIHYHGMHFDLRGFQCVVLLDWRDMHSTADWPWDRLCDSLRGAGVPSIHDEMKRLRLRPLHDALRQAINTDKIRLLATIASEREPASPATAVTNGASKSSAAVRTFVALAAPDFRLQSLVEKSQAFFDKLLENIPAESRALKEDPSAPTSPEPLPGTAPVAGAQQTLPSYAETVRAMASAAAVVPSLAQSFSTDWPDEARRMLPGRKPGAQADQAWAPVLAWLVLRSLPFRSDLVPLFDELELRSALADTFASMGMEGEAKWRAAAQVRMLLQPVTSPAAIRSADFWNDPDVRWLAGVNKHSGITYINREQFEELLAWLQLPDLIKIAQQESGHAKSIADLEASFAAACETAHDAGYRLDKFLAPPKPQPAEPLATNPAGITFT